MKSGPSGSSTSAPRFLQYGLKQFLRLVGDLGPNRPLAPPSDPPAFDYELPRARVSGHACAVWCAADLQSLRFSIEIRWMFRACIAY
jgi:hypothetical protein